MTREAIEERSGQAFARSAWSDPRAEFRTMLRRLKEIDESAFESAVREYETTVVERLADAAADPVTAWLGYGERLAASLGRGRTVSIDAEGRAADVAGDWTARQAALLLHLPKDEDARALVVACPREPSAAQRAARDLLAEGRVSV